MGYSNKVLRFTKGWKPQYSQEFNETGAIVAGKPPKPTKKVEWMKWMNKRMKKLSFYVVKFIKKCWLQSFDKAIFLKSVDFFSHLHN